MRCERWSIAFAEQKARVAESRQILSDAMTIRIRLSDSFRRLRPMSCSVTTCPAIFVS